MCIALETERTFARTEEKREEKRSPFPKEIPCSVYHYAIVSDSCPEHFSLKKG